MARDITENIVLLVSAGFDYEEVLHRWPYDRFQLFVKAAKRRELDQRMGFVSDLSAAVGGLFAKGNATKDYLSEMRDVQEYDL